MRGGRWHRYRSCVPTALVQRARAVPVIVQDAVLAALVTVFELVSLAVAVNAHDGLHTPPIAFVLLGVSQLPLVVRRRHPELTWFLVGVGTAIYGLAPWVDPPVFAGALLAIYSVAAHAATRTATWTVVLTLVAVVAVWPLDPQPHDLNDVLLPLLGLSTAWLIGYAAASQRRNTRLLEERAERVERDRAAQAVQMLADERMRIARELHDMTAHHVAVIAVHAEAGQSVVRDPDESERAFATIGRAARDALHDLRRTLGVLRTDAPAGREPLPGIADIETLVTELSDAGVSADLELCGDGSRVDDDVELAAYRIVQEAMTNVLKHASARHVVVRVRKDADAVDVEVVDDGSGALGGGALDVGHGIVGMRERAASCHGILEIGPRDDGPGFRVHARLPT
jgi:signal transduction histidine kinase